VDDERRTPSREQTADERMLLEEAKKRWVQIEWDVSHFEKLNEETRTSIEERFDAIVELLNELDIEWVDSEKFDDLLKMLHLSSKYMRTVLELELERKRTNGSTEAEIVDLREASQRIAELRRRSA